MVYRVSSQDIADFLGEKLVGENITVEMVSSINEVEDYSLTFSKSKLVNIDSKCLILIPKSFISRDVKFSYIKLDKPRLAFAKVINKYFCKDIGFVIHPSVAIGKSCNIAKKVSIGVNTIIGDNVSIGEGTVINNNCIINDNTIIKENCYIKSASVIGEDGFGFDFEEDGAPIRVPHIGNVKICNNVEIGAKNTISRGTLGTTLIEDNVKIDDQVHIAHNCKIGKNTIITACAEISGSVIIGENCWIGPNCSIIQKVRIGNKVTIGIGAIITKDIDPNKKIMGLESLELKPLLKVKKRIEYGR